MATLLEINDLRSDPLMSKRVEAAIATKAQYIISTEAPEVTNHRNRTKWAINALQQPAAYLGQFLWAVAGSSVVQAAYIETTPADQENVTDVEVQEVVDTAIDIYAGGL